MTKKRDKRALPRINIGNDPLAALNADWIKFANLDNTDEDRALSLSSDAIAKAPKASDLVQAQEGDDD